MSIRKVLYLSFMHKKPKKTCTCINFGFDVQSVIQDLQVAEFAIKKIFPEIKCKKITIQTRPLKQNLRVLAFFKNHFKQYRYHIADCLLCMSTQWPEPVLKRLFNILNAHFQTTPFLSFPFSSLYLLKCSIVHCAFSCFSYTQERDQQCICPPSYTPTANGQNHHMMLLIHY